MRAFFKDEIEIDSWGGPLNILEISSKNVNKAYALNYLLGIYNMDKKDLIAFGDEHNDTEMLAFAGTGYAMKNASPVLLPYADQQLNFSNEEDGVAKNWKNFSCSSKRNHYFSENGGFSSVNSYQKMKIILIISTFFSIFLF